MASDAGPKNAKRTPWWGRAMYAFVVLIGTACSLNLGAMIYQDVSYAIERSIAPYWQSGELEKNLAKWESRNITHYRMSLELPCSSSNGRRMPLIVEVKDGKVVSVVDALGEIISPERDDDFHYYSPYAFTIPGLFSHAYQTIWERPPSISVSYDPVLGYPSMIEIDPWEEPCCQWEYFTVQDLQVLAP